MSSSAPARFQWRAFVTLFVTLSFLLIAASGIVLYVAPPGRVAHWSVWTLGGLDKEGWQAVHTVFAFLFVLAGRSTSTSTGGSSGRTCARSSWPASA